MSLHTSEDISIQDTENNNIDENSNSSVDRNNTEFVNLLSNGGNQSLPEGTNFHQYENHTQSHLPSNNRDPNLSVRPRTVYRPTDSVDRANLTMERPLNGTIPMSNNYRPISSSSVNDILPLPPGPGSPHQMDDETREQTRYLVTNFTQEELNKNQISFFDTTMESDDALLQDCGRNLRSLADQFSRTKERRKVRELAKDFCTKSPEDLNMETFFILCRRLFEGGVTSERIVALFTFIADIAILYVQERGPRAFIRDLMEWAVSYIVKHLCEWVKRQGGWGIVLRQSACYAYNALVAGACAVAIVAGSIYIYNNFGKNS